MQESSEKDPNWSFDLPPVGTWFYFLIIGFPISIILLLIDTIYIPFTDKPNFVHRISKYAMTYNGPEPQVEFYERTPVQKVLLALAGFVLGIVLLVFSLILSIFSAFKPAVNLQENIVLVIFPAMLSEKKIQTETMDEIPSTLPSEEPSKDCPACGEPNELGAVFCIGCGSNLPAKNV